MDYLAIGFGLLIAIAIAAFSVSLHEESRRRAEFDVDVVRVRDVAVRYAAHRCGNLPGSDTTLSDAALEIGVPEPEVQNPDRWAVRLTPRPGGMGFALDALYNAPASAWQVVHLLQGHGAVRTATGVAVSLDRRRPTPGRSSFQLVLEGEAC